MGRPRCRRLEGTALGPQWLGSALGFDELAWRAILARVALTLTIIAIALPEKAPGR